MLSSQFRPIANRLIIPTARLVASTGISPNTVTIMGLFTSFIVAYSYYVENLVVALLFFVLAALFDVMDGAVARISNLTSERGAFLDSVLDRYSDVAILVGIGLYMKEHYLLIAVAIAGFLMVSYSRSKAEQFIDKCDVGIGERAERLIILMGATIIGIIGIYPPQTTLYYGVVVAALLAHITAIQRIYFTSNKLRGS